MWYWVTGLCAIVVWCTLSDIKGELEQIARQLKRIADKQDG